VLKITKKLIYPYLLQQHNHHIPCIHSGSWLCRRRWDLVPVAAARLLHVLQHVNIKSLHFITEYCFLLLFIQDHDCVGDEVGSCCSCRLDVNIKSLHFIMEYWLLLIFIQNHACVGDKAWFMLQLHSSFTYYNISTIIYHVFHVRRHENFIRWFTLIMKRNVTERKIRNYN
jgi:hypothetical protein